MHTTELTKQNAASRIHDPHTCLNLRFHKIYRHCVRYFSLWIMSHQQNQLEWKNRRDTDRSRLLCRPPFSLENQHTTEPRCSVVCVYAARLCAGRLGGVEGHPWFQECPLFHNNDMAYRRMTGSFLWVKMNDALYPRNAYECRYLS